VEGCCFRKNAPTPTIALSSKSGSKLPQSKRCAKCSAQQQKLSSGVIYSNVYIVNVRTVPKLWIGVLATAIVASDGLAIVPDSTSTQYQDIKDRNVFGLRPPQVVTSQSNLPPQVPKITLTGITTILGNKRALMKMLPVGLKPGETAKEVSLILTEGQRESEVEVLQIDEKAGSVRVNNSGTVMTLTFEKDGAKLPATSGPGAGPGVPNPLPVVGAATNPYLPAATAVTGRKFPTRTPRSPGLPPVPGATGTVGAPVGGVPTPTGTVSATGVQQQPAADPETTAEEQAIIQEIQRQINANAPVTPTPNAAPPAQVGSPAAGAPLPVPGQPPILVPQ
jgi:hypothetical protein